MTACELKISSYKEKQNMSDVNDFGFSIKKPPAERLLQDSANMLHREKNYDAADYLLSLPYDHPFSTERTYMTINQHHKVESLPAWQRREVQKRRNDFYDTRYIP
jgi:hypothetical protein